MARKAHTDTFVFVYLISVASRPSSFSVSLKLRTMSQLYVLTHAWNGEWPSLRFALLHFSSLLHSILFSFQLSAIYSKIARYLRIEEKERERERERERGGREGSTLYHKSGCCSANYALVSYIITVHACFLSLCSSSVTSTSTFLYPFAFFALARIFLLHDARLRYDAS